MKTYKSTLMALIFFLGLSACGQRNTKHQELLNWLDSNEHTFSLDTNMSEDSAIIRVLTSVSDFNQQATNSSETEKEDAVDYLEQAEEFDNYLSSKAEITQRISLDDAQKFHDEYKSNKESNDSTSAILFTLAELNLAIKQALNPRRKDLRNPQFLETHGFFIFPANYGSHGRGPDSTDKYQTTAIVQFASSDASPLIWTVVPDRLFNFGDMKPPIRFNNPTKAPQ